MLKGRGRVYGAKLRSITYLGHRGGPQVLLEMLDQALYHVLAESLLMGLPTDWNEVSCACGVLKMAVMKEVAVAMSASFKTLSVGGLLAPNSWG